MVRPKLDKLCLHLSRIRNYVFVERSPLPKTPSEQGSTSSLTPVCTPALACSC